MNKRESELLYETLELLRETAKKQSPGVDWKDTDDRLFSELSFTITV